MTGVSLTRDDFIRQYLAIDPASPTGLTWTGHPHKTTAVRFTGKPAGRLTGEGYYQTSIQYTPLLNHRIIWFLRHGKWPAGQVDHIDGVRTNNHPDNLRDVTHAENLQNQLVKGYAWVARRQKWWAQISVDGKRRHIGYFTNEEDARAAYLAAKAKYHPTASERCFD